MIEVKNISKRFENNQVLSNVSAVFDPGKINFIIGRSGSGKSVLTKCIVGLMEVDEGNITYDGRNFTQMSRLERKEIRKDIGMLFQGGALFDSLSVEENVMFPLRMFSKMTLPEMTSRVEWCLHRVELDKTGKLFPSELSGGMQKRTGIARAIAMNPKYLFCDEPNSGLDPQTAIVIDNLIKEITYELGITTIVVSHDMNSVMEIGDNINFIYDGKLWWRGSKTEVLTSENKELNDFVFASEFMKDIKENLRNEIGQRRKK